MKYMWNKYQELRPRMLPNKRSLDGKYHGEQDKLREKQLPYKRDSGQRRYGSCRTAGNIEEVTDCGKQRTQTDENQHHAGDAIEPAPWVVPQNYCADEEQQYCTDEKQYG